MDKKIKISIEPIPAFAHEHLKVTTAQIWKSSGRYSFGVYWVDEKGRWRRVYKEDEKRPKYSKLITDPRVIKHGYKYIGSLHSYKK